MAGTGAVVFSAGISPLIRRRDNSHAADKSRQISNSKLSVFASVVPTEKQPLRQGAPSVSVNGVVEKKSAADILSSIRRGGEREAKSEDGQLTSKDFFEQCGELISRSGGGPPRWFSPLSCGSRSKDSPVLLSLPGVDGVGLGLLLHHERLGKIFDIWCMHIPFADRTSFTELVKLVESTVRLEYSRNPNRPIYLVGESFGGCLALAVAARNPDIDLILILANPATSFTKSQLQLQTLVPLSTMMPEQLRSSLPYMLTLLTGAPLKMVAAAMGKRLPLEQVIRELSQETMAMLSNLSVLSDVLTTETLGWKLEMLKSGAAFANSRLHAVKAQTLILASGQDQLLPSKEEAERLRQLLPKCEIRVFDDKGHALFLEDGVNLVSILTGTSFYRRGRHHDYVLDGVNLVSIHRKGEEYKLFWPEQSEFVRMAARFGAKIVPFGSVGEDDIGHFKVILLHKSEIYRQLFLDYNDLRNIPYLKDAIEDLTDEAVKLRSEAVGEVANQDVHFPIILPKVPGRFYYLFGKPIETQGRQQELKSREKADELYLQVKSEVEKCLAYLKEKRESDPYRNIFARLSYQATHGFDSEVPTFDFTKAR